MERELRWVRLNVPCYDLNESGELVQRGVIPEVIGGKPTLVELESEFLKAEKYENEKYHTTQPVIVCPSEGPWIP